MSHPAGLRIARTERPGSAGIYRDGERPATETLRIRYRAPRSEAFWLVVSLFLGVALVLGFVGWLGARSGIDVWLDFEPGDEQPYLIVGAGAALFVVLTSALAIAAWPGPAQEVELDAHVLRGADGLTLARESVLGFSVGSIAPPRGRELAGVRWHVVARTSEGELVVLSGLPSEAHATTAGAALAAALRS